MQRMTRMTVVAVALLAAAAGCKKETTGMTGGSNTGSTTAPAVQPPPAPAATAPPAPAATAPPVASGPYALPAGARTIDEHAARKADATSLGSDVALRFVDKLGAENDGSRRIDEMLVLTGASAMILEIAYE